jgi:putative transcriptional regulator
MGNSNELKKRIAGEIVLSKIPGETIKKWREIFKISQTDLAKRLGISASVISDYESGRRKSPGIKMVERLVGAIVDIDKERGGKIIDEFISFYETQEFKSFILSMKEFERPVNIKEFLKGINGEPCYEFEDSFIFGYSLIDSRKAIIHFSPLDLSRVSSLINRHCLIFTNLSRGRSPLVALRLANLKPGLVILHGIKKVDDIALRIAKIDKLPLAISYVSTVENLIKKLEDFSSKY